MNVSAMMILAQDVETLRGVSSFVTSLGGFGVLVVVSYLGLTRKIVTRGELDELRKEKDMWRDIAIKGITNNERLTGMAERTAGILERSPTGVSHDGH